MEKLAVPPSDTVINCQNIRVSYQLPNIKVSTFKEMVLRKIRGELKYSRNTVLHDIDFEAKRGECVAFVGHNGCGKSTLLKVIAGILKPQQGNVQTRGRLAPLIELGAGFDPELSGRENVFLNCSLMGLSRAEIVEKMPWIESFSELAAYFDAPIKTYSSGMYMRLGFSCSMAVNADTLLIDEILAVGDSNFQKKCTSIMHETRYSGTTIILVSHDTNVIKQLADRVVVIDNGYKKFEGNPGLAIEYYNELMEKKAEEARPMADRHESERKQKLVRNSSKDVLGHRARLMKAEVIGPDLDETVTVGMTWRLRIFFEVFEHLSENPTVGFAIHDQRGIRLTGGNSKNLSHDGSIAAADFCVPGKYTAEFSFADMSLATGDYRLITAIHDHLVEKTLDINIDAANFRVQDGRELHNFDHDLVSAHHMIGRIQIERVII